MALSPEAFEDQMAHVVYENRWATPNTWEVYLKHHLTLEGTRVFALEHCVFANHFPRWFGNIVGNCPFIDARQYMIENMYVEEVTDPTIEIGHYESMVDFTVALGLERDFVYGYRGKPYTKMALAYWDSSSRGKPWLEAFAAVGGLEAARGPSVKALGPVTPHNRKSWEPLNLPEEALSHWKAGEAADFPEGGHGDMTLKILAKYADTDAKQDAVLTTLEESTQVRWYHFDQIGRDAFEASKVALPT
ncbi:MAG: iron-containing redox enzyme family protein [Dehalococcoidia bacterium]